MGIRGNRGNVPNPYKLTAEDILGTLNMVYLSNPKYLVNNLYVFGWESDYAALTQAGYWYEVEVKISRADFLADRKKKVEKHNELSSSSGVALPNYFAYCVPTGLIDSIEVPEYAGLYYVNSQKRLTCVKLPPLLHKEKIKAERLNLADKFYYNYKNLLEYRLAQRQRENELRGQISRLRSEYKAATGYDITEII